MKIYKILWWWDSYILFFGRCYRGDQIQDEMSEEYDTHGEKRNSYRIFLINFREKNIKLTWKDVIRIYLKEIGFDDADRCGWVLRTW